MPNSARASCKTMSSKSLFLRQPEAASACQPGLEATDVRSECVVAATMKARLGSRQKSRKQGRSQEEDWYPITSNIWATGKNRSNHGQKDDLHIRGCFSRNPDGPRPEYLSNQRHGTLAGSSMHAVVATHCSMSPGAGEPILV